MTSQVRSPIRNTPQFWDDQQRMDSLYSLIRPREVNPVDYEFKIACWQKLILEWCLEKNTCLFTIKTIQEEFKRDERIPLGLLTVVENLERNGHVKTKNDFLKINPDQSWGGWAVSSLVMAPAWSFAKLMNALMDVDPTTIEYISLAFLKAKTEELSNKCTDENNKLYSTTELRYKLTNEYGTHVNQECFDILLKWMLINKVVQVKQKDGEVLVKFGTTPPISDLEVSVFILEKNKLSLDKAIIILEKEKANLIKSAKSYLEKGMRDTAKSYLRRKKELEKIIDKRISAAENIDSLLGRIYDTSTNSKVLETYKVGLQALKASFRENGLSEEDAYNTISEIQEVNDMHNEIQNALSEPITPNYDHELDEELQAILESETREENIQLPDIPDVIPGEGSSSTENTGLPSSTENTMLPSSTENTMLPAQ